MCLGIPARVIDPGSSLDPFPMGEIDVAGERRPCCFAYVPEAVAGDWVLVQNSWCCCKVGAVGRPAWNNQVHGHLLRSAVPS